nr:DHHA1 domain-containing protein [Tissierella sp.]
MTKKSYIDNPYLKEINATIIESSSQDENFHIKLDRTIFFPDLSGGQPRDLGSINDKKVIDVYQEGDDIIHVVEEKIDESRVLLKIDWKNRFDLMQQHTGQHILSASFENLFNAQTIGFHMGENYITIDVNLADMDQNTISQIEILANKIVQSNFKVINKTLDRSTLKDEDLSKVSEDEKEIRIVSIDNISSSPCCGTHVSSTGEIGLIKIVKWEKYKGNTRVSFICGNRALEDYGNKTKIISEVALSLACGSGEVLERFNLLKDEREALRKEKILLQETIISFKAESFLEEKKNIDGIDYIMEVMEDIDKKELNLIASQLNKTDNLIQIYKIEEENNGSFIISRSSNLDLDLKSMFNSISEKIIVKGGGNEEKIQGSTSLTIIDRVVEMFYKEIKTYFKTRI